MKDFESPLDPGCQGHQPDLKQDAKTVRPVIEVLDRAIISLKDQLMFSRMNSESGMYHGLCRLGQLQDMRNRLTGERQDIEYILSDDGECSRYVAGFLGDSSDVGDIHGRPLRVGDTVMAYHNGEAHEQMIILGPKGRSQLPQEWLDSRNAVFQTDFREADIETARRYSYPSIDRRSCLEDYFMAHDRAKAPVRQPQKAAREER